MSKTTEPRIIHIRASGVTLPAVSAAGDAVAGRVMRRGEEVEITPDLYAATIDRTGASFLDQTPEEQVKRYGMVKWADGPCPPEIQVGDDDEGYRYKAGLRAREDAKAVSNPTDRREALADVEAEYGDVLHVRPQYNPAHPIGF
ncbi:MAG TPA: hypothetical protein VIP82_19110 [Microbacterium sp.]|uniref:hypothetical protein n=1 Tax=Microbacterium sp. TaxID=51671 RepID=UPI002F933235